jgi:hypothetical protein
VLPSVETPPKPPSDGSLKPVGQSEKNRHVWQFVVAILPIIGAIGYFMAYLYELGYCQVFHIPSELIQLQTTTIISSIGKVFLSFSALYGVIFIFVTYVSNSKNKKMDLVKNRFFIIGFILLVFIAFSLGYQIAFRQWYDLIPIVLYFTALLFLLPIFTQHDIKGYKNKLFAQDESDRNNIRPFDKIFKNLGFITTAILIFSLPLLSLPYFCGQENAMTQKTFLVPSNDLNAAVLRIYNNEAICVQVINPQQLEYFILKLDDPSNVIGLTYQNVPALDEYRNLQLKKMENGG